MFHVQAGGEGVVRLVGRLDAAEADGAMAALSGLEPPLTADCAELDYISSAGLGVIMETYKRLHRLGHSLRLINVPPRIRNVFRYAGLDRVLQID